MAPASPKGELQGLKYCASVVPGPKLFDLEEGLQGPEDHKVPEGP